MDDQTSEVVRQQQIYCRKRAAEYDATSAHPDFQDGQRFLAGMPIHGDVLELACGTGRWTPLLAERTDSLTAVDGAPEMLAIARRHVRGPGVELLGADVFTWTPPRRIVKVFYSPHELIDRLTGEGWSAAVHRIRERFLAGTAQPPAEPA
jgi:SAM-dependent methyltransferase